MSDLQGPLQIRWYPVPTRPWHVEGPEGMVKSFDSASAAQKWLEKKGYIIDEGALP